MITSRSLIETAQDWAASLNIMLESYFSSVEEQLEYAMEHEYACGCSVDKEYSFVMTYPYQLVSTFTDGRMVLKYSVSDGWYAVV